MISRFHCTVAVLISFPEAAILLVSDRDQSNADSGNEIGPGGTLCGTCLLAAVERRIRYVTLPSYHHHILSWTLEWAKGNFDFPSL